MGSRNGRWGRASVVCLCLLAVVASTSVAGVTTAGDAAEATASAGLSSATATGTTSTATETANRTTATETVSEQTPYGGDPHPISGTVRAEAFDRGGEGVAYHDTDPENVGGAYRSTGVDVDQELDGSYYVGWIEAGEWLEYTVTVPETGEYAVTARASTHDESGARFRVDVDGTRVGSTAFGDTGGWRNWVDRPIGTTGLSAGTHVVRVYSQRDGWNFDALVFERVDGTATDAGTTAPASTESPTATATVSTGSSPTTTAPASTESATTTTRTESTASGSETAPTVQRTAASSTTGAASTATGSAVPTDTTGGSGPGFGPVAALTGALGAALFARRR